MMHPNDKKYDPSSGAVFVFGSNLAGIHGAGAARYAHEECGAVMGQGWGLFGKSFAIPTKDENLNTLDLSQVKEFADAFIAFAKSHPTMKFFVTRIGCGLAGFSDHDIAPFFSDSPDNCELPLNWDTPEKL